MTHGGDLAARGLMLCAGKLLTGNTVRTASPCAAATKSASRTYILNIIILHYITLQPRQGHGLLAATLMWITALASTEWAARIIGAGCAGPAGWRPRTPKTMAGLGTTPPTWPARATPPGFTSLNTSPPPPPPQFAPAQSNCPLTGGTIASLGHYLSTSSAVL
jgi:hypothetical protein